MNQKTSRFFLNVIMAITLALVASCKSLEMAASWTDTGIVVDGMADDWSGLGSTYIEDNDASIGLANDSSRLYLLLRFRDPRWAAMIRHSGLTFWLDAEGKEGKDFMIRYREGPTREEMRAFGGIDNPRDVDREPDFMTPDTTLPRFTCFVEGRIVEMGIPEDGSLGPAAGFAVDQGFFTYEFSVPLTESALRYYGLGVAPGQIIGIGAKWGGRDSRAGFMPGRNDDSFDGGPPVGGGRPGGRGGGRSPGGGGKRPDMPKAQEVWLKAKLADRVETE